MNRLVVIAGSGSYPRLLVEGAKRAGVPQVDVVALRGSTERATWKAADRVTWISIGTIAAGIRAAGRAGYDGAILAGQVNPLTLFSGRFDREVQGWLDALPVKNAHSIFTLLIGKFAEAGLTMLPASLYMDDHIPAAGVLTARAPTEAEMRDFAHAQTVAHDVGIHDVGQTVVVKGGMVLAVEAFEGTNRAIKRGGKLGGRGAVVFKAAREGHDMRFDIPVIGLTTLKTAKRAGVTAVGFQTGRVILVDRERTVAYADRHGIAMVAVESGLPPAPLRP